jgi:hypothetical protein
MRRAKVEEPGTSVTGETAAVHCARSSASVLGSVGNAAATGCASAHHGSVASAFRATNLLREGRGPMRRPQMRFQRQEGQGAGDGVRLHERRKALKGATP